MKPECYIHKGEGYDRFCHRCIDLYVAQLEADNEALREERSEAAGLFAADYIDSRERKDSWLQRYYKDTGITIDASNALLEASK